jgi:type IV pilus assembly protein PilM
MSPLPGLLTSPPPSVGVEIASDRVTAVSLARQAASWIVGAPGSERLAPGVVTPALNAINVHDTEAVAAALRSAFEKLGTRPRRIALVIPDTAAKVSLLRFDKIPAQNDLDQLIRWQMRKAAPFKPEEAQLSWVPAGTLPGGGREYLVTLARRDIIESYMNACAAVGADAGVVDLASLNLVNAAIAAGGDDAASRSGSARIDSRTDWLVVHVAPDYATLAIVRNKDLIFFRTRASASSSRPEALEGRLSTSPGQLETDADLADLVHQTAMYYEDRLEGDRFARVVLSGASARGTENGERLRRNLEERLGVKVATLDAVAPAAGVVLRERVA